MAFDDLDEALEEQDGEDETVDPMDSSTDSSSVSDRDDSRDRTPETTTSTATTDSTTDASADDPAEAGPAFPYDAVKQSPIYPRESTWDDFEEAVAVELTPRLYQEGIKDVEKREIHDAILRLASENVDDLAELILQERQ